MEPRDFFRQLIHNAINAAIYSTFWKMSLLWTLVALAVLIGIVVVFGLY
jgi:hypothetical protein